MYTGDIVIHIDEELDDDRIHDLERHTGDQYGVNSAAPPASTARAFVPESMSVREMDTRPPAKPTPTATSPSSRRFKQPAPQSRMPETAADLGRV